MVNSGSSANLLALQCLINPYRKNSLKKGDEVIIPTLCWSTSLWPIIQSNLKPVFVDINPLTLNIDENQIEKKITKKTKAILLVHVLGNSCDMNQIMRIKKKYNLILIEDNCESLGSKYAGKHLGTYGDFSSFSFYSSHQISSGEGVERTFQLHSPQIDTTITCFTNIELNVQPAISKHRVRP